jgi:hypothetical protein
MSHIAQNLAHPGIGSEHEIYRTSKRLTASSIVTKPRRPARATGCVPKSRNTGFKLLTITPKTDNRFEPWRVPTAARVSSAALRPAARSVARAQTYTIANNNTKRKLHMKEEMTTNKNTAALLSACFDSTSLSMTATTVPTTLNKNAVN